MAVTKTFTWDYRNDINTPGKMQEISKVIQRYEGLGVKWSDMKGETGAYLNKNDKNADGALKYDGVVFGFKGEARDKNNEMSRIILTGEGKSEKFLEELDLEIKKLLTSEPYESLRNGGKATRGGYTEQQLNDFINHKVYRRDVIKPIGNVEKETYEPNELGTKPEVYEPVSESVEPEPTEIKEEPVTGKVEQLKPRAKRKPGLEKYLRPEKYMHVPRQEPDVPGEKGAGEGSKAYVEPTTGAKPGVTDDFGEHITVIKLGAPSEGPYTGQAPVKTSGEPVIEEYVSDTDKEHELEMLEFSEFFDKYPGRKLEDGFTTGGLYKKGQEYSTDELNDIINNRGYGWRSVAEKEEHKEKKKAESASKLESDRYKEAERFRTRSGITEPKTAKVKSPSEIAGYVDDGVSFWDFHAKNMGGKATKKPFKQDLSEFWLDHLGRMTKRAEKKTVYAEPEDKKEMDWCTQVFLANGYGGALEYKPKIKKPHNSITNICETLTDFLNGGKRSKEAKTSETKVISDGKIDYYVKNKWYAKTPRDSLENEISKRWYAKTKTTQSDRVSKASEWERDVAYRGNIWSGVSKQNKGDSNWLSEKADAKAYKGFLSILNERRRSKNATQ